MMATTTFPARPAFSAVRHQPVAEKPAAVRRRQIRHGSLLVAVAVIVALLFVWIRIQVIQLGYEVSRIRKETTDLKQQKNRLAAEVEVLKEPSRLEAIAQQRFGMRLPQSDEIVIVNEGGAVASVQAPVAPGPGTGNDAPVPDR